MDKKIYLKKTSDSFLIYTDPNEHIQQQLFWYGYYEPELVEIINKIVKPGDVFIDGGANIGYFSLLAANNGATVFAFEPVSEIFEKLKINLQINNENKVTPFQKALGDITGRKEIYISGSENIGMSSFEKPENFIDRLELVDIIRMDDWMSESGVSKVNIIKLDLEGSEFAALKGMEKSLMKYKPVIICEINSGTLSQFGIRTADIFKFMEHLEFKYYEVTANGKLRTVVKDHIEKTTNFLFIHDEKREFYKEIIN